MSDELENNKIEARKALEEDLISPSAEDLIRTGDLISKSLSFALKRSYLRSHVINNGTIQIIEESTPPQMDVALIKIEQVGKPVEEIFEQYFSAIQTALAASHDSRYTFLYFISSDGLRNQIYFGVAAREDPFRTIWFYLEDKMRQRFSKFYVD